MRPNVLRAFVLLFLAVAVGAMAQDGYPSPRRFVENLDVRCYKILTPRDIELQLDHLNPLFQDMGLPPEKVDLDPQQLCVPVQKNDQRIPDEVLRYLQYVDWRCHGITGPPLDVTIKAFHLNREIIKLFGDVDVITVREPQQLCVPVAKDGKIPPDDVLKLIQWLDVKCYRVDSDRRNENHRIRLTHLNPLLAGEEPEHAVIEGPGPIQLCVPVAKNKAFPPDDVLKIIAYSDVLCYRLKGRNLDREIKLEHLNPVLREIFPDSEVVKVTESEELCVPVAKNGLFPPE